MKEHLITMVYLGLLFSLFNSPFPNRLLETDNKVQGEPNMTPEYPKEAAPLRVEEKVLERDSFMRLSPGVAAYAEIVKY